MTINSQTDYANLLAGVLVGDQNDPGVHEAVEIVRAAYPVDFDRFLPLVYVVAKFIREHGEELRLVDMIEAMYLYLKHSKSTTEQRMAVLSTRATPLTSTLVN